MKKLLAILFVCICATSIQAQYYSTKSRKAIELFERARITYNAAERESLLTKAIGKDKKFVEAYWLQAQHALRNDNYDKALQILVKIDRPDFARRSETQAMIAEIYYLSGQYQQAVDKAEAITDGGYMRQKMEMLERFTTALDLYNHPVPFDPVNLKNVNTRFDDYFPSITADGRMISTTVLVEETPYYNQEDLYWSRRQDDGTWQIARPLAYPMNSDQNEGSQSFSADGRYMFFVACDRKDGIGSCDIYYALRIGTTWSKPICIDAPVNTPYWESNPVLSPAGDELFFVSNRPPCLGGKDIWHCRVEIAENGLLKFSDAANLGAPINTDKDDYAPFIHADNQTLYFASNGHFGLGRSDIFMSRRTPDGWTSPQNIGYPINSNGNEAGFVVDAAGTKAYFSSDRIESNGQKLDIYEITLPESVRPAPMAFVSGRVFNAVSRQNIDAVIEIFDNDSARKIYESLSDRHLGEFTAYLPVDGHFGINVHRKGFLFYSGNITSTNDSLLVALQPAKPGTKIVLHNLFFAFNSAEIEPQSTAEIAHLLHFMRQNPKVRIEIVGHTDNIGTETYNRQLSQARADALRRVLIEHNIAAERIVASGKGSSEPVADNDTETGRAANRRVEIHIIE
ncbi:MAG: OmpA family protein [Paludibacteraceae bacterium]